jgi:phage terminase large subunit GpA-like protein
MDVMASAKSEPATLSIATVRARALRSLIPAPKLDLADWIEREIVLPEGVSALPGKVRLWPYQRQIASAISDPLIERITLVKPVRVGFTTLLSGAIGSFVANEPAPILALLPTEADCRDYMVSDIEPIFAATPVLRGALADDVEEGERNTLLSRRFPGGGSLKIVAARAPRNLRRHTARILIVDEADACEAGPEGNPIRLGERRTFTFANRKIIIGSTPIFADTSAVLRAYGESDQRIFECPCPECGAFIQITWANIEWPEDRPQAAAFRCPSCKALIDEHHKPAMVAAGQWRATRPDIKGHAGFRLNALVSLLANAAWGRLAQEFLACKNDPAELQVFSNTILAEGWSTPAIVDESALAARAEAFDLDHIPPEVLTLEAGCDVQDDRVEVTITGWTRTSVCLVLGHFVIWGSFTDAGTWDEVDELLRTRWRHPWGGQLKIDAACIDAGDGDHFDVVLNFCVSKVSRRVFAIKGMYGARPGFQMAKGKRIANKLALVGVDTIKNVIFDRLQHGRGIRFSHSLEPVYYEQLASERRVIRYSRGQPVRRFERTGRTRAEALDCLTYAHAARQAVNIPYDRREAELHGTASPRQSLASRLAR